MTPDHINAKLEEIKRLYGGVDRLHQEVTDALKGKTALHVATGRKFRIRWSRLHDGNVFFHGPVLTKSGAEHSRSTESGSFGMLVIEP